MGARLGARIIDSLIIGIPLAIIGAAIGAYRTTTTCHPSGICTTSANTGASSLFFLLELVVAFGYFAYFIGEKQQTPGMRLLKMRVVDGATGGPIGFGRGLLREVVLSVTGLLCLIGYFSPFFDSTKRRQGWHDKAANDFVLRTG
jgi:uncharacterized RDD family membrane protein YckC